MKITKTIPSEQTLEDNDYQDSMSISIDGEKVFAAHDGEPEDNTLSRNFNDCYKIIDIIRKAYDAGKAGESIEFETIED